MDWNFDVQMAWDEVGTVVDIGSFDCSHNLDLDGLSSPDYKSLSMDHIYAGLDLGTLLWHWLVDMILHGV